MPDVKGIGDEDTVGVVLRAVQFAARKHSRQRRKDADASPYINHPIALAALLKEEGGIADPVVLSAALLHDTIEDTETTEAELRGAFGDAITNIVLEVSDNRALPKNGRKQAQIDHAPSLSPGAKLVKLADKICNLRDVASAPPADWPIARRQEYFDWAKRVVDCLRGAAPHLERVFDDTFALRPKE